MTRRLLNLLTALSLLLCVAVVALWARSYVHADLVEWQRTSSRPESVETRRLRVVAARGLLIVRHSAWWDHARPGEGPPRALLRGLRRPDGWRRTREDPTSVSNIHRGRYRARFGFAGEQTRAGTVENGGRHTVVSLPFWFVATLLLVLPIRWLTLRTRRALTPSCDNSAPCLACGYDLRATPDRCPECGAAPAAAPAPD